MGAEVRIVYQPRPKFMLGPLRMWAWGEDRYKTTAKLDNGEEIRFAVEKEPRAIWRLQGAYYVACYSVGRDWLIARIDGPGKLTPISRGQLPQGELDWNLEPAEYRAEWRERFDREVK